MEWLRCEQPRPIRKSFVSLVPQPLSVAQAEAEVPPSANASDAILTSADASQQIETCQQQILSTDQQLHELHELIETWTTAAQSVLVHLKKHSEDATGYQYHGTTITRLLENFGIAPQLVRYNIEDKEFY